MSLLALGALVLLGLLCAKLARRLGLPAVTGYLVVGVLAGPSAFHMIGEPVLASLKPVTAFGVATIFFLLGEEFKLHELRRTGRRLFVLTLAQSLATFALVAAAAFAVGAPPALALLLGAIAGTSDPAATLVVIREMRGRGELVRTLLAVVALNGFVEMLVFSALMPVVEAFTARGATTSLPALLAGPAYEFGASAGLGVVLALVLRTWSLLPGGRDSLKAPTIGLILLGSGLCEAWHLSALLVMLTFGAMVANTVPYKVHIFDIAKAMEGPLLIMFFGLAGANLHLAQMIALGGLGVAYVGGRMCGKISGAWLGARLTGATPAIRRYLGCGLIPQASMAIGLAYFVQERFPDLAGSILPVVLGGVVVFEAIGPILTRIAILRTAEPAPHAEPEAAPAPKPVAAI